MSELQLAPLGLVWSQLEADGGAQPIGQPRARQDSPDHGRGPLRRVDVDDLRIVVAEGEAQLATFAARSTDGPHQAAIPYGVVIASNTTSGDAPKCRSRW